MAEGLADDKGYPATWLDEFLPALGIAPVIPTQENLKRDERPVPFVHQAYRQRNIIERLIGWLKECRRAQTRFKKTAKNFGGIIKMAFIERYFRSIEL